MRKLGSGDDLDTSKVAWIGRTGCRVSPGQVTRQVARCRDVDRRGVTWRAVQFVLQTAETEGKTATVAAVLHVDDLCWTSTVERGQGEGRLVSGRVTEIIGTD